MATKQTPKPRPAPPSFSVSGEDADRFLALCAEALLLPRSEGEDGIGTLGEKRLHAVIKRYLSADTSCHEVKLSGTRYVSDVRCGEQIFEVQTGSFYPLRQKIAYYLEHTDCTVTLVHPICVDKWVLRFDPETGEATERRRSPKQGRAIDLLAKLSCLAEHFSHPRLEVRLLLLETLDVRIPAGRGASRWRRTRLYERLPLSLRGDLSLRTPADLRALLPDGLPSRFTVKTFSALTRLRGRDAYSAVQTLLSLGLLLRTDEQEGRARVFALTDG